MGVIEHYSDERIRSLLKSQLAHCKWLIVEVPTRRYFEYFPPEAKMHQLGERLLVASTWKQKIEKMAREKAVAWKEYGIGQFFIKLKGALDE